MLTKSLTLACAIAIPSVCAAQEPAKPRLDTRGLPLPEGALARLQVREPDGPRGFDATLSPDGGTLIVRQGTRDNGLARPFAIGLYDPVTGLPRGKLDVLAIEQEIAIARTRPLLACATAVGVEIWDVKKEACLKRWAYPDGVRDLARAVIAIAPDGSQVAVACAIPRAPIWRFDLASGARLPALQPHPPRPVGGPVPIRVDGDEVSALRYSADGSRLFSYRIDFRGAAEAVVWDRATGARLAQRETPDGKVAFAPTGNRVAVGDPHGRSIAVMELDPKAPIMTITIEHTAFEFIDGKRLLVFAHGQPIRIWDVEKNKEVRRLDGLVFVDPWSAPPRLAPDGKHLVGHEYYRYRERTPSSRLQRWDLETGKLRRFSETYSVCIDGVAFAPDGKRLATFGTEAVRIFDPADGTLVRKWIAHEDRIEQIAYAPDGKLLATGSQDGTIGLWDPETGVEVRRLAAKQPVLSIAFARDGKMLTAACADHTLQTWDVARAVLIERKEALPGTALPWLSPQGEFLAAFAPVRWKVGRVKEGTPIHLMDVAAGKTPPALDLGESAPHNLVFSADGSLLAASTFVITGWGYGMHTAQHTVRVFDTRTRKEIVRFDDNPVRGRMLAIAPDNRTLVHGVGRFYDSGSAGENFLFFRTLMPGKSESLDASKKGEKGIDAWLKTTRLARVGNDRYTPPHALVFSPDGSRLVSAGWNESLIWDVGHFLEGR